MNDVYSDSCNVIILKVFKFEYILIVQENKRTVETISIIERSFFMITVIYQYYITNL